MTHDIHTLLHWLRVVLIVAAICATLFPILYLFSHWWSTMLGRLLMLQGVAFALALDVTCLFTYWRPTDILVEFWIDVIVFTLIAVATASLTVMMIRANYKKLRRKK